MYFDFFGISESPFSITPDPRYLYMSKGHHEALAHLLYGVSVNGGFVLLTGEVGTGKTSVCRCLLEQLPDTAEVALMLNPRLNELELLAATCDELGIAYPKATTSLKVMVDLLNSHLLEIHAQGRHAVIIIDEAQDLSPEVLEQVRLLTNLETETRKLLQIILIGQPELSEILRRPEMRQLAQRVTAHYHLEPLGQPETPGYIRYRLAVGGLSPELFTARATAEVHKHSGGIPRIINSICDRCLLGAYAQDQKVIDHRLVRSASKEVFGSPRTKQRKRQPMRWPVAAAIAALLVLVFTPTVFGLFAKPIDWRGKIDSLLFKEAPVYKAEVEPRSEKEPAPDAERAVTETQTQTRPEAGAGVSPQVKAEPKTVPSAGPATKSAVKPTVQAARTPAPQIGAQGTMQGANYLSSGVLAPAAAPAKPVQENEKVSSAPQIASAPAASPSPAGVNGATRSHTGSVDGHTTSSLCRIPSATGGKRSTDPGDLLRDPAARQDEQAGLALLFSCWNIEFHRIDSAAPCTRLTNGGLECLKGRASWKTLAQINRPALVTLADTNGQKSYAVVSAFDGNNVTLLSADRQVETNAAALERFSTGEYLILWRPPPLYYRLLARGARGEDVVWLKNRFAQLNDEPSTTERVTTFGSQLHERVVAFQMDRGLTADGIVGARTLIHINTVTSDPVPPVLHDTEPSAVASE